MSNLKETLFFNKIMFFRTFFIKFIKGEKKTGNLLHLKLILQLKDRV